MPDTTPTLRDRIAAAIRAESSRVDDVALADAVLAVLPEPPARQVLGTTDQQPDTAPDDRRARYAAAIRDNDGWVLDNGQHMVDAVMAVADAEQQELHAQIANLRTMYDVSDARTNDLIEERDQLLENTEAHRLALSEALGLGTGAPWDAIRDRAAELNAAPVDRAAVRDETALELGRDLLRDGLPQFLHRLVGPQNAARILHDASTDRAAVLREAASSVESSDVAYNTEAATAALTNGGPFALIAFVQLAIGAHLRRMADEAQQPETENEDESCGRFVPDTPRAPGLCASCGDARGWHSREAVEEQPAAVAQTKES